MIFQFPDLETFRLAVTTSSVPAEVAAAPAQVAFDAAGRPSIQPAAAPPRAMQTALKRLGVPAGKTHYGEATLTVESWPQVLPVTKVAATPEVTSTTPVLFELPVEELPTVVTEMLRLGNDRQSFRTLAAAGEQGERVLLKVIGPPYYTLLRAIDKTTQKGATVTAYVERAPRVWVELGHDHPLAGQIKPAEGQALLLKPPRDWTTIADGPFKDVYDILDLKLPAAAVEWQESQLKGKLSVPLRLVAGNAADGPEMWVLTENAVDQLDALVRDADERLMARLSFAVAAENGSTTIVLKTRPSKLSPPVLALDRALGFKPYWKLPNLFLPVGRRLMPTLRRDAVRKLLADDPAQIVWLMPGADGKFTPELLPDDAFRPLEDWVDYIIDHERDKLTAWVQATHFDFESFVCPEEQPDRPKPPAGDKPKKGRKGDDTNGGPDLGPAPPKTAYKKVAGSADEDLPGTTKAVAPNELKVRRGVVEKEFLALAGGLDEPDRQALWPELGRLNASLSDLSEAGICWANALWEMSAVPVEASWGWLQSEDPQAKPVPTAAEWDAALSGANPSPNDVRRVAARVVHACRLAAVPESFVARLPKIREYLEKHETVLGLRVVWLVWVHITAVGHGAADVLALARVRDRLLQRLLTEGLNKERDLPYFLRTSGDMNSERTRLVRDRAVRVRRLVEKWHVGKDVEMNKPYVDLLFAFGMARLGETTAARDLLATAKAELSKWTGQLPQVHAYLFDAFRFRIEAALEGKPHTGPLSPDLMARLEKLDENRPLQGVANPRYFVDRLRDDLWILEPHEKAEPYRHARKFDGEIIKGLFALSELKDVARVEQGLQKAFKENRDPEGRTIVLWYASQLGPRVGEEFTVSFLAAVPPTFVSAEAVPDLRKAGNDFPKVQRRLLARALFLAAHYDRPELVKTLFHVLLDYVKARTGDERNEVLIEVARDLLRSLRKLGLKDEIDVFLSQVSGLYLRGRGVMDLRPVVGKDWKKTLTALLAIAEGWLFFGGQAQAKPILDAAIQTILEKPPSGGVSIAIPAQEQAKLIRAYLSAIGQGPVEDALLRIETLFQQMPALPNTATTSSHYSRLHLGVVEDLIRSLISDNMALGDQARRWLDDDEYLVRRRIHTDMNRARVEAGL